MTEETEEREPADLKPGDRILLDGNIVRIDRDGWYWDDINKWQFSYRDHWGDNPFFLKPDEKVQVYK